MSFNFFAAKKALPAAALLSLALSGCGNPFVDDLRQFVDQSGKTTPSQIPALPPAQEFTPQAFAGGQAPDPFGPRRASKTAAGGEAPDANRKKEFLESMALGAIHMTGFMTRGGNNFAMVTAGGSMVMVQPGNHMGLNYGRVVKITADGIGLIETVQDDRGEWVSKNAILPMTAPNQPDVKEEDIFKKGEGADAAAPASGASSAAAAKAAIPPAPGPASNRLPNAAPTVGAGNFLQPGGPGNGLGANLSAPSAGAAAQTPGGIPSTQPRALSAQAAAPLAGLPK